MHHGALVRLTVNLEEAQYRLAKSVALAEDCSISEAVNKLLARVAQNSSRKPARRRNGFPVVKGCRPFTSDDVYKIEQS